MPKELIFEQIGYKTFDPAVDLFHRSKAPIRVVTAPNRGSKSYAAGHEVLGEVVFPPMVSEFKGNEIVPETTKPDREECRIWIVAPDYSLCKEFEYLWTYLVDNRNLYGFGYELEKQSFNVNHGSLKIVISWGIDRHGRKCRTIIEGKSAGHEKGLQGEEVHFCVVSEAADQEERIFVQYLAPRVRRFVIPTTPKIHADWVKRMIEEGVEGVECFVFPPQANPDYQWDRFRRNAIQAEHRIGKPNRYQWNEEERVLPDGTVLHQDQPLFMEEGSSCAEEDWKFAETFLGHWSYASERVLPFKHVPDAFGICHVLDYVPAWVKHAPKYVAIDYGFADPSSVGFWAVSPEGLIVKCSEIYEEGLSDSDLARATHTKLDRLEEATGYDWKIRYFAGDPQRPTVNAEMVRAGLPIFPINPKAQNDRQAGLMRMVDLMSVDPDLKTADFPQGRPRLYVLSKEAGPELGCPKTIQEWKTLRYKKQMQNEFAPSSIVGADHALDEARYFVMTNPTGALRHAAEPRSWYEADAWKERARKRSKLRRLRTANRPWREVAKSGGIHALR